CMFPAKIENLRRNPVCLQRYRHVVARKRQHGLTTTLIYATTPVVCQTFLVAVPPQAPRKTEAMILKFETA
ncbi:hypothetical protein, partial [Ralstonia pseudosolanacearum]|uniref:hypothetical protein n=1 Tax=Ralstonia pseudosolanacearum TaxID=1310165 RepID=UPI002005452A